MDPVYKRILVCIDGSKNAKAALCDLANYVRGTDIRVDILRVLDINSLEYGGCGLILNSDRIVELEEANETYMKNIKHEMVHDYGLKPDQVFVHLRFGNPKTVIVDDFQPEYHSDLIVVGSAGKNFIERLIVGSVASYVLSHAKCDVLVSREVANK